MELLTKLTAVLIYPMVLGSRGLNILLRRDPLRLREPVGTCWVERRAPAPRRRSYFSEASEAEGSGHHEGGLVPMRILVWVSRLLDRSQVRSDRSRPVPGPQAGAEIPDEVYTLW